MTLIQGMLQFMPANAEPLLPPHEVKAYSTSEKPCAPPLLSWSARPGTMQAMAEHTRMANGVARHRTTAQRISPGSIFLPRNSGVRPTMRPAMNTVRMAKPIMPYRPQPTPPKTTSPRAIWSIWTKPPSGV
ncbi:Uncharacterised protein [Collinsella intestinalis]|nr:Uncharacterised protein [Collinsella intestinalis]